MLDGKCLYNHLPLNAYSQYNRLPNQNLFHTYIWGGKCNHVRMFNPTELLTNAYKDFFNEVRVISIK